MPSNKLRGSDILEDDDKIPFWVHLYTAAGADATIRWLQPFDGWIQALRGRVTTVFNNTTTVLNLGIIGTLTRNFNGYAGVPVAIEDGAVGFRNYDISGVASRQVFAGDAMVFTLDAGTPAAGEGIFSLLIGHQAELDDLVT